MSTPTAPTAATLLSARWTPSTEPGVILAELGPERGAVGLAAIDPHRALDLSDADAATLAGHVASVHNMAICTTPVVGCTQLLPETMEHLAALAATPGTVHTTDEYAGVVEKGLLELTKAIFDAPTMAAGYEILADWAWQCGHGVPVAMREGATPPAGAGSKALTILREMTALFEMTDEAQQSGTDSYTVLWQAREFLKGATPPAGEGREALEALKHWRIHGDTPPPAAMAAGYLEPCGYQLTEAGRAVLHATRKEV